MTEIDISTPWRRDPGRLRDRFTEWFRHVLPAGSEPVVTELTAPEGNGLSSETLLLDVVSGDGGSPPERFVAWSTPAGGAYPVFPEYDLELQFDCMRTARAHTTIPVPEPRWYEADESWTGSPFLVMNRVDGIAPKDLPPYVFTGWLIDASPEDRARAQRGSVGVLAGLHVLRAGAHDLSFLDRPRYGAGPVDQMLAHQREYYEWAREGVDYPIVERLFEWMHANRPAHEGAATMVWGDSRIGNLLYSDFTPVAVLDWEMAALGPGEIDVAWMIWMHRFFQDVAEHHGMPGIPGFLERADVIATYEELSGRALSDMEWYEVLAALRHAIITIRTSMRGVVFGQAERPADPDDLIGFRHLLDAMISGTYFD